MWVCWSLTCAPWCAQKTMELFKEVYEDWRSRLGEAALETVKAVTMLSTVSNKLEGPAAAVKWSKMEVAIREEIQGAQHPRTQQAKRNHASLLKALAAQTARQRIMGDDPAAQNGAGGASANGSGAAGEGKSESRIKVEEVVDSGEGHMNALMSLVDKEMGSGSSGSKAKDGQDRDKSSEDKKESKGEGKASDQVRKEVCVPCVLEEEEHCCVCCVRWRGTRKSWRRIGGDVVLRATAGRRR